MWCVSGTFSIFSMAYTLVDFEYTLYSLYFRVILGSRVVELFIFSMLNRMVWKRW